LRRNLNRQKAFRYRTQSHRRHKSGTQLHPQFPSSHPVCLTYYPVYVSVRGPVVPDFQGHSRNKTHVPINFVPNFTDFIPSSRRGDGNSAAHGAINSKVYVRYKKNMINVSIVFNCHFSAGPTPQIDQGNNSHCMWVVSWRDISNPTRRMYFLSPASALHILPSEIK
jgi:hypothetical protein